MIGAGPPGAESRTAPRLFTERARAPVTGLRSALLTAQPSLQRQVSDGSLELHVEVVSESTRDDGFVKYLM